MTAIAPSYPMAAAADAPAPGLWLHSRTYDLAWYAALPVFLWCLLCGASAAIGPQGPMLAYLVSSVLTGFTHNSVTWLLIMPEGSRGYYMKGALLGPFVVTALLLVPTILLYGSPAFGWALSLNISVAYFHIVRQHQGMLQICDARYVQHTGDAGFRLLSKDLRWGVGALAAACAGWKLTGPPMKLGLMVTPMEFTFYPLPMPVAVVLSAMAAFWLGRFAWRMAQRHRQGATFPAVHVILAGAAMANLTAAALVPNEQFFLTLALCASYHNLQYFAFVYTHHHLRASQETGPMDLFTRAARDRRWLAWFALPVACGLLFSVSLLALPPMWQTVGAVWFMTSHYFVDANIWRRKYYPKMGRFGSGRVGEPALATEVAPRPLAEAS